VITAVDLAEYEAVRTGLAAAARRRELAGKHRADAMRETGVLMRRARDLAARVPGLRVEVTDAAGLTGLSRPTLYGLMAGDAAAADSGDYEGMSDAALAAAHLACALSGRPAAEFAWRFPAVEALREAARMITQAQPRVPIAEWPGELEPGAGILLDAYRQRVEEIAGGRTRLTPGSSSTAPLSDCE
jgi:hypothetical protein